ncbi:MAG: serine/threonine-protein kinase [Chloroflexota bacterium]
MGETGTLLLILLMSVCFVLTICGLVCSAILGIMAFVESAIYRGEYAKTLRFVGLNQCEPAINAVIVSVLLFRLDEQPYGIILATLPMAILCAPILGLRFQNPTYRSRCAALLILGMLRWICNVVLLGFIYPSPSVEPMYFLGIPIALFLLGISIWQCRNMIDDPPTMKPVVTTQLTPLPTTTSGTPTTPLQLPDLSTAIWCAVCHTPTALDADHCHLCGLVFVSRLPSNLLMPSRYTLLRPLAIGGLSHVYLARDTTTDQLVVFKTLASIDAPQPPDWHTDAHACLTHEAQLLRTLDHPGLPRAHIWLPHDHTPLLVLEHIAGPTLEQTITVTDSTGQLIGTKPLSVAETLSYAHGIVQTLVYLADQPQPIVHGDLKPTNLIAATDRHIPVLLDFGNATRLEGNGPTTVPQRYGTPGFAAPEQYHGQVTRTSDVYGLGATLYHLLTADDPSTHPLHFPALSTLPPDLATLLTTMLDRDPDLRPTSAALEVQLQEIIVHNLKQNEAVPVLK